MLLRDVQFQMSWSLLTVACVGQDDPCFCTALSILDLRLFSLLQITDERNLAKTMGQSLLSSRNLGRESGALGSHSCCVIMSWLWSLIDCKTIPQAGLRAVLCLAHWLSSELPFKPVIPDFYWTKILADALLVQFLARQP